MHRTALHLNASRASVFARGALLLRLGPPSDRARRIASVYAVEYESISTVESEVYRTARPSDRALAALPRARGGGSRVQRMALLMERRLAAAAVAGI